MAKMTLVTGPHSGKSYSFQDMVRIGRASTNNITLIDKKVSNLHAQIGPSEKGFAIIDMNSTNGTKVNGKQIEKNIAQPLQSGDKFSIGDSTFLFESKSHPGIKGPEEIKLTPITHENLATIAKWLNFVGIVIFIYGIISCITIVGAIFGWIYIVIGNYAKTSAQNLKQFLSNGSDLQIHAAFQNMRDLLTWIGVITIISLSIVGLSLLPLLIIFLVSGSLAF